jgi:hypothetical protein
VNSRIHLSLSNSFCVANGISFVMFSGKFAGLTQSIRSLTDVKLSKGLTFLGDCYYTNLGTTYCSIESAN